MDQPKTPCPNCGSDNWKEKPESLGLDEQEPIESGKPDKHGMVPTARTGRTTLVRVWYCNNCSYIMLFGQPEEEVNPYDV